MNEAILKAKAFLETLRDDDAQGGDTEGRNAKYGCADAHGLIQYVSINPPSQPKAYKDQDFKVNTGQDAYGCHNFMRKMKDPVVVFSKFMKPGKADSELRDKMEEPTRTYFNWLVSSSPWTDFLWRNHEMDTSSAYLYENGFIFDKLHETPANYLLSFLVASRMPREWPEKIARWHEWTVAGVDSSVAFFFLSLFYFHATNKTFMPAGSDQYDWPIDPVRYSEKYFRNFLDGKMSGANEPYQKCQAYSGVNAIWCDASMSVGDEKYKDFLIRTYSESLGNLLYDTWNLKNEELIEVMKQETERCLTNLMKKN